MKGEIFLTEELKTNEIKKENNVEVKTNDNVVRKARPYRKNLRNRSPKKNNVATQENSGVVVETEATPDKEVKKPFRKPRRIGKKESGENRILNEL